MDMKELKNLKEYIEQSIREAGGTDRLNLRMIVNALPSISLFYEENESNKELVKNAFYGEKDSIEEVAQKLNLSSDEKKAFQKYLRINNKRLAMRKKEEELRCKENNVKRYQYPDGYPNSWFKIDIEKINRILKYISMAVKRSITIDNKENECLFLEIGIPKFKIEGDYFQLIVPIPSGYFYERGQKTEFNNKYIIATYKRHLANFKITVTEKELLIKLTNQGQGTLPITDIDILGDRFHEFLNKFPVKIMNIAINRESFPGLLGFVLQFISNLNIELDKKSSFRQELYLCPEWDSTDLVQFHIYMNQSPTVFPGALNFSYNKLFIRKGDVLYRELRETVIKKLEGYHLKENEYNKIVVDDTEGVIINGDLHLYLPSDDRSMNFFEFKTRLIPKDKSFEVWIRGEVKVGCTYHGFKMRSSVYYDADIQNYRTKEVFGMKFIHDSWAWSEANSACGANQAEEKARDICRDLETEFNKIKNIQWDYPFLLGINDISIYRDDGCISVDYTLDI